MCAHTHTFSNTRTHTFTHTHMCTHTHTRTFTHTFTHSLIHTHAQYTHSSRVAFYGVYDGHAGPRASKYAAENLHQSILTKFPKGKLLYVYQTPNLTPRLLTPQASLRLLLPRLLTLRLYIPQAISSHVFPQAIALRLYIPQAIALRLLPSGY